MKYVKITPVDIANGPGCRVVFWTAGCSHHCKGCHNADTWNPDVGIPYTEQTKQEIFKLLDKPYIQGITLSGGDPLHKNNVDEITELCKELKEKFPQKTIWCYSGYLYEMIQDIELMNYIDVLVDGKFELEKRDITLLFRGSSNQRLIDVPATRQNGFIVLYKGENNGK